jgi:hypothetical protein
VRKALRVAKLERGLSNVSINQHDDYIDRNPVTSSGA